LDVDDPVDCHICLGGSGSVYTVCSLLLEHRPPYLERAVFSWQMIAFMVHSAVLVSTSYHFSLQFSLYEGVISNVHVFRTGDVEEVHYNKEKTGWDVEYS